MSIQDEWIVLDTNVWIFGLRRTPEFLACADLLQNLNRLQIVLPRQILQELKMLAEDHLFNSRAHRSVYVAHANEAKMFN